MAIETEPGTTLHPGGGEPAGVPRARAWWMRPAIHTGLIGAVVGYVFGHWLGNYYATPTATSPANYQQIATSDANNFAIVLGYAFMVLGWLIGLGVFNDLVKQMAGRPVQDAENGNGNGHGLAKYFRLTLDHKVVGIQYLVGMIIYFCTAGLLAMGIRTELLSPVHHVFSSSAYIELVGEHGTMMMMLMTSVILGPFGNYLIPLMIGSKRVAYPRLEALSFWLTPAAFMVLLSALLLGGFHMGWTGYPTLSVQDTAGANAYAFAFGLMGISMTLAGFNILVTVICYRAPGMRWSRIPMFVWGILGTSVMMTLAAPILSGGMYMLLTDRTVQTAFFTDNLGGSTYLYQDVFWFFGHPEVYILALPGFGIVCELLPVFTRKPLFGYKVAAAGMIGVTLLSFFVWQHHLFDSGINPDMRPLFMLTTEMISIPTGFIFLVGMGTLWKAKIRFTVPMLFALAFFFNFLIGGISGVFNSDAPADVTEHGSFVVMAHFHYTIMGGLIFAFMGGCYYWLPKMMGIKLNEKLGKWHFWLMFLAFNSTFMPLFAIGWLGQPRRVFEYARNLQTLNDWVSISSFVLGFSILLFIINFVWSTVVTREPETGNPWDSRGLEWQVASPPPAHNFERVPVVLSGPYEYGVRDSTAVADLNPPTGVLTSAFAGPETARAEA
ncbi:MAG TPA: cbb3-type cytochrome c oxidase subunit I [Streptosporangiaceae bacterium]|nr:cbb3-type cytochrome c oxidase subunit I [Streptosporangiaceae bacterium]